MTNEQSDDLRLVSGVRDGDESALESIFGRYGAAVRFVAKGVLRDDTLAEDVVQDVFVSLWRAPERFVASRGSLRTYLLTIAHRRAVDIVRSENAGARSERSSPPQDASDVDHEVWLKSQSDSVRTAFAGLGEEERRAISLAYFGGLDYVEVAQRLGLPEGTVKSRIRSGMRKLSSALTEVAP